MHQGYSNLLPFIYNKRSPNYCAKSGKYDTAICFLLFVSFKKAVNTISNSVNIFRTTKIMWNDFIKGLFFVEELYFSIAIVVYIRDFGIWNQIEDIVFYSLQIPHCCKVIYIEAFSFNTPIPYTLLCNGISGRVKILSGIEIKFYSKTSICFILVAQMSKQINFVA